MKKCKESGCDFSLALLNYRTTPLAELDYSPAELLMSRNLRTTLPCTKDMLKPCISENVMGKYNAIRHKSKQNYDKSAKIRKPLEVGGSVVYQNRPEKVWYPGKVVGKIEPRSYIIKKEDGTLVRRNKKHVLHSSNNFIRKNDFSDIVGDAGEVVSQSGQADCSDSLPCREAVMTRFGDKLALQGVLRAADLVHSLLWRWSARWCSVSAVLLHKDIVSPSEVSYWRSLGVRCAGWCVNRPLEKLYWRAVLKAPYLANTLLGEPEEKRDQDKRSDDFDRPGTLVDRLLDTEKRMTSGQN